jgi:ABC-type glycerol-3-phosphate transport system substrate-binding protein
MVETRPAEGVDGVRRRPAVCRTPEGRGAASGGSDASPDRSREEGGQAVVYSALELNTAERLARTFEAKYPGIAVRVERSGAERIFQRIAQEQGSGIKAVDVANSTDPAHYLEWKKSDWLAPYFPRTSPSIFRPIRSIPTACTRRPAPGWR